MAIVTVDDLRDYGPGAAFVDVADGVLEFHIDAAERTVASYIGERGYQALTDADSDFKLAILKMVTWNIIVSVRGVNPADPAHAALKMQYDEARSWLRDVQRGEANISGATPARARTGTSRVFSTGGGAGTRGW